MCKEWGVLDDDTVADLFQVANQDLADFSDENNNKKTYEHKVNTSEQLRRFEFFDFLACIAQAMAKEQKNVGVD